MENTDTLANVYIETEYSAYHLEGVEIPDEALSPDEDYDWLALIADELDRMHMAADYWNYILFYNEEGLSIGHRMSRGGLIDKY